MKVLLFIIGMLWTTVGLAGESDHRYWYSQKYDKWFEIYGECTQYNGTDSRTCNTGKDHLKCDWDHGHGTCYPESSHGGNHCSRDAWYSKKYHKCYKKYGYCSQYDGTDHRTCNTNKDKLYCDWDRQDRTCFEEEDHQS